MTELKGMFAQSPHLSNLRSFILSDNTPDSLASQPRRDLTDRGASQQRQSFQYCNKILKWDNSLQIAFSKQIYWNLKVSQIKNTILGKKAIE